MLQWTLGCMYLSKYVFFWIYARSGITWLYGNPVFSFLRKLHAILHSNWTSLHSHQHVEKFPFLHTSLSFIVCRLFSDGHSDPCEVVPHCSFDLHFSNTFTMLRIFSGVYRPSVCLCWRNVCLSLLPIFWLGYFSDIELHVLLVYFGSSLTRYCKISFIKIV